MMPLVCHLPDSTVLGWINHFPPHLAYAVRREWLRRRNRPLRDLAHRIGVMDDGREREANEWLRELVAQFPTKSLELGASDEATVAYAKARAQEGEQLRIHGADLNALEVFCQEHGMPLPSGDSEEGIARRVGCSLWWRRNLRRVKARQVETMAISLGLVHKRNNLYCSNDAVNRRGEQQRRNRALLDAMVAINELGQEFTLAELADKGMANPAIRRAELMTRIAGFEYIAVSLGMAGEFITLTAPSRFHPRRAKSGQRNPKYDGSTPGTTRDYLAQVWSRITASLARQGIKVFGFRVAEPHHDGTPHLHGLFFMDPSQVRDFRLTVARYAVREDRAELGKDLSYALTKKAAKEQARELKRNGAPQSVEKLAERIGDEATFWSHPPRWVWKAIGPRVWFKAIDWNKGSAAGYIAKYIAKNIDGVRNDGTSIGQDFEATADRNSRADGDDGAAQHQGDDTDAMSTARRVDAWAATWGIRQFQQVGGPPVGVWRELRRYDYGDAEGVLMQAAAAADVGHWARFVEVMGGLELSRRDMPLQLAKDSEPVVNRYGEAGQKRLFGVVEVDGGQLAMTRVHEWKVLTGREAAAWTRVNNSTNLTIGPVATQATDEDRLRWLEEIAADDLIRAVQPLDDQFQPPAQLAEHQRRQRAALRRLTQARQRAQEAEFMQFCDHWVNAQRERAEAEREAVTVRRRGRELHKQFAGLQQGIGIALLAKVREEQERASRPRPSSSGDRWKAEDGSSLSIKEQLAAAMASSRQWMQRVNPDPHGVLNLGRA
ncbi:replication endonuclease [Crenobacter sp. SG2303]|uniref:Replication endonuclease n=1 Tax=Crenobacter oryzisoli TaxID=3056844 RepID=A0ABT7XPB0_9NEIS|nr:replication endonuclease [Crenobacter sp. SG2303]MDN0075621.1 replication endonuclease [Crenobacter sp. SG2303]